jgi:hypothetical protein
VKFAFIRDHLREYPLRTACRVLAVSPGGYYAWRDRPASPRQRRREQLAIRIQTVHVATRRVYGSPRIHQALVAQGEKVCRNTVAKVMRQRNIRAKTKKKFVPRTTDSTHDQAVARNLLERQFAAALPNQKWVTDITYIPTDEGWLYLAGVLAEDRRLVDGRAYGDGVGPGRSNHGPRPAITDSRSSASQRPRQPVRQRRLSAGARGMRDDLQHERPGRMLGQRVHGEFLVDAQDRAGASRAVRDAGTGPAIDL